MLVHTGTSENGIGIYPGSFFRKNQIWLFLVWRLDSLFAFQITVIITLLYNLLQV
jgi:hypothetical protein